jgi:phasin
MIDAGPSLRAAEGLNAAELLTYLVSRGWTARPSRVDGISILSKAIQGADRPAEFILPINREFDEEHRRIADALRTLAQLEGRSEASVAEEIREFAGAIKPAGSVSEDVTMLKRPVSTLETPGEMRAFAEQSVERAKRAFDGFIAAADKAAVAWKDQAAGARTGARDLGQKVMVYAEQNVADSFEFAQQLVRAKDVQDMLKLQADYIQRQMQVLAEQAKELGKNTSKAVNDAAKPKG